MKHVRIIETGPRDGFQNIKEFIPSSRKLYLIEGLVNAGIKEIEVTSFVSPKSIPQMSDAKEIASTCIEKYPHVQWYALVPNLLGALNAWEAGVRNISYVVSLSESHNKANVGLTREESLGQLSNILEKNLPDTHITVGIATAFGCPFEGIGNNQRVVDFVDRLHKLGVRSFYLADTIGIADPKQVREIFKHLIKEFPDSELQVHIHDTRNMGMVNILAAIECGITTVHTTLGGLGGCPFAPGASGNVATEDLVYMLERMGYSTGIDYEKLLALSKTQRKLISGIYSGHHLLLKTEEIE